MQFEMYSGWVDFGLGLVAQIHPYIDFFAVGQFLEINREVSEQVGRFLVCGGEL